MSNARKSECDVLGERFKRLASNTSVTIDEFNKAMRVFTVVSEKKDFHPKFQPNPKGFIK